MWTEKGGGEEVWRIHATPEAVSELSKQRSVLGDSVERTDSSVCNKQ